MKHVIADARADEFLRRWEGGIAKIWLYHVSLRRMALRVERPGESEVLYVVATGCDQLRGPFRWPDAHLTIANDADASTGENICRVIDSAAGFELICSRATLATGPANEVDQSFEDFLGDAPSRPR